MELTKNLNYKWCLECFGYILASINDFWAIPIANKNY
jgi:hypothetical protein